MTYSRVMCLVRGDDSDAEAVETAVSLLTGNNRNIRFVYVIVVDRNRDLDDPTPEEYLHGESVLRAAEQLSGVRGEVRGIILQSRSIAPVLIREALDYGADAIVAGVKILTSIGKKTIDPDSEYLLENAPCAVVLHRVNAPGFETDRARTNAQVSYSVARTI